MNTSFMKEKILSIKSGFTRPKLWGVMQTPETNFSTFLIKYLGEIENKFENTLSCLSGAQMDSNYEKNSKSHDTLPLRLDCFCVIENY